MQPFSLLVKPTSGDCNLNCEYCFYLKKSKLYPDSKRHRMTGEVLEQLIKSYMATEQPSYSIGWQGGEPTLMGLDFFQDVTRLEQKHGRPGATVGNGLQTNATLITDEMAAHFARYRFLVGVSMDGPEGIHDRFRVSSSGRPSFDKVEKGIEILARNKVEFNLLVLVSRSNVAQARRVYRYLRDRGFNYHQYIPCVEFDERGEPRPFAISGEEWGDFLLEIFDEWFERDTQRVSVRYFDSIIHRLVKGSANVCDMGRDCCQYLVVEHNGDIYPCDFFVEKGLLLGNVMDTTWAEALGSPVYKRFGAMKAEWNRACEACDHLDLCSGDCLKHRVHGDNPPDNLSWLCPGIEKFLGATRGRFEQLAREVRARLEQERALVAQPAGDRSVHARKIGRNAPCPCGSGLKYKRCCGGKH